MAILDGLTEDIAMRFDLGLKARALVRDLSSLIAAQPGGIDGFLDKFRATGLEAKVASWLGGRSPMALSVREVKMALGDEVIDGIAENAGVSEVFASGGLGYAIPKIIGLLTSGGAIPEEIPSAVLRSPGSAYPFSAPRVQDFTLGGERHVPRRGMEGGGHAGGLRLIVPGAALLITLGLIGYVISSGTAGDHAPIQSASSAGSHESVIGADHIKGDFAVTAGWIKNLSEAFDGFRSQGSQALFAGNVFHVGGTIPHADRAWMIGSLQSAQLPQIVVAALTGGGAANLRTASSTSKLDSSGNESVRLSNLATLDFPIIIFPANSAKIPSRSLALLRRIAEQIKQLPPGTVVQLNGYTHGTRTAAADVELAQRRADSVYRVLVHEGVSPVMLSAKGYGSSPSVASINGIMEGRSSKITDEGSRQHFDRRVEFRVVQQRP